MVKNVFAQNCVAVVFLVSILLNLVLPKKHGGRKGDGEEKRQPRKRDALFVLTESAAVFLGGEKQLHKNIPL